MTGAGVIGANVVAILSVSHLKLSEFIPLLAMLIATPVVGEVKSGIVSLAEKCLKCLHLSSFHCEYPLFYS